MNLEFGREGLARGVHLRMHCKNVMKYFAYSFED